MKKKLSFDENSDIIKEQLKDKDFSRRELISARKYMGSRKTTRKQWKSIIKMVGLIYFYAPKEISEIAHATLLEMTMREPYMEKLWNKKGE